MHRKYLALAGVLSLVTVTAGGCKGSEEKDVKNIKVGVTLYSQYDTFISELMTEFTEYAADKEESSGVAINLEILDASQSQLTQNEQVKNLIDKGCDVVCVNLVDRTDEGIEAVKNEEMLGTVYNDKEGQAREMLDLAFVIATDGDKSDIPLIDGKYVRTPYHKLTLENIEEYE